MSAESCSLLSRNKSHGQFQCTSTRILRRHFISYLECLNTSILARGLCCLRIQLHRQMYLVWMNIETCLEINTLTPAFATWSVLSSRDVSFPNSFASSRDRFQEEINLPVIDYNTITNFKPSFSVLSVFISYVFICNPVRFTTTLSAHLPNKKKIERN